MMLGVLFSFTPLLLGGHAVRLSISVVELFIFLKYGGFKMKISERIKSARTKVQIVETLIKVGHLGGTNPTIIIGTQ